MKTVALFVLGLVLVTAGMALTLAQWDNLAMIVKACAGPVLAVAGCVAMFAASVKKQ